MSEPLKTALLDQVRLPRFGPKTKELPPAGPTRATVWEFYEEQINVVNIRQTSPFANREKAKLCLDCDTVFRDAILRIQALSWHIFHRL